MAPIIGKTTLPLVPGAKRVLVEFGMYRGSVSVKPLFPPHMLTARMLRAPTCPHVPTASLPNVTEIDLFGVIISKREAVPLEITHAGDVPQILRFLLDLGGTTLIFEPIGDWCSGHRTGFAEPEEVAGDPEDRARGPRAYLDAMRARLGAGPNTPLTQYRWHFFDLDCQTHPMLVPLHVRRNPGRRLDVVRWVADYLVKRCRERARQLNNGDKICLPPPSPSRCKEIGSLARMFASLIVARFAEDLDDGDYDEAFTLFANGDLRFQLDSGEWTTQPSSGWFFLFGEFALVATEVAAMERRQNDRRFWEHIANVMVRSQHIYARVYAPRDRSDASFGDYHACNYDGDRRYVPSEMACLAQNHRGRRLGQLFMDAAENARDYMPGLVKPKP